MTLRADPRAVGLVIGEDVQIGEGVELGGHVVIHDHTAIGAGSSIEDHVVLGKVPRLARTSATAVGPPAGLTLADEVTVCAGAVVFAGAMIGEGVIIGDQAFVRERSVIGAGTVIGRATVVDNDVTLGERVSVQSNVYITAFSVVEDDVFIGPGALMTNDDTMSRHGPETRLTGAVLRRGCRIGGGVVLTPGIEIGEEAFIAAGAVVTRDVAPRAVVMGVPGRVVREVPDEDLLERWR